MIPPIGQAHNMHVEYVYTYRKILFSYQIIN
jgi:hypothetical protein